MASDRKRQTRAAPAAGAEPSFWREVYWFVIIVLSGSLLAICVVPPRAARHRRLLELEASLQRRNERLQKQAEDLEAAAISMRTDPLYREAVYRKVLGLKRQNEEVLSSRSETEERR